VTPLSTIAEHKRIRYFLISFSDLRGVQRAKLVPAASIDRIAAEGAGFAGFATWLDMTPADPDMFAIADPKSLIQLPWQPEVGWLAGDLVMKGKPVEQAPRRVLERQVQRAKELGLTIRTGVECEFFVLCPDGSAISDPADHQSKPCYDQQALMRRYNLITEICDGMQQLGWGPYQNDHEDANGQFEMNWGYSDALTTADRHAFFKYMAKSLAERHELRATFMPKPFSHLSGNGCHVHVSGWSTSSDQNLFADPSGELGLSKMAYQFMAGVLEHAEALCALTNPTVNSFKRINGATTASGATWSPNTISYTGNNRTHMIRIPDTDLALGAQGDAGLLRRCRRATLLPPSGFTVELGQIALVGRVLSGERERPKADADDDVSVGDRMPELNLAVDEAKVERQRANAVLNPELAREAHEVLGIATLRGQRSIEVENPGSVELRIHRQTEPSARDERARARQPLAAIAGRSPDLALEPRLVDDGGHFDGSVLRRIRCAGRVAPAGTHARQVDDGLDLGTVGIRQNAGIVGEAAGFESLAQPHEDVRHQLGQPIDAELVDAHLHVFGNLVDPGNVESARRLFIRRHHGLRLRAERWRRVIHARAACRRGHGVRRNQDQQTASTYHNTTHSERSGTMVRSGNAMPMPGMK
jgi:glutamate---methylamine ligase